MIKLEWWNSYDIMDIYYEGGYQNRIWLKVDIQKPNYPIQRETEEDSVGEEHNVFLKWEKQYAFTMYCTEPLADALSAITMHDDVWVTFANGYSAKCKDFLCNVSWESAVGGVAKCEVLFITKSYNINGASAAGC
jgi:hypothetical protein